MPVQRVWFFFLCLCLRFLHEGVCFLPALTEHHGDPAEHFCIIGALLKVDGEVGPPEEMDRDVGNRENGKRMGREEEANKTNDYIMRCQRSKRKGGQGWWWVGVSKVPELCN